RHCDPADASGEPKEATGRDRLAGGLVVLAGTGAAVQHLAHEAVLREERPLLRRHLGLGIENEYIAAAEHSGDALRTRHHQLHHCPLLPSHRRTAVAYPAACISLLTT